MKRTIAIAVCLAALAPVTSAQRAAKPVEWPFYGGDQGGTKYSPLDADQPREGRAARARVGVEDRRAAAAAVRHDAGRVREHADHDRQRALPEHARTTASSRSTPRPAASSGPTIRRRTRKGRPASGQGFVHRGVAAWRDGDKLRIFMNSRYHLHLPRREDRAAGRVVRHARRGRRRRKPGVADSEEALLEHVAAGRLQGPRHPRQRRRRSADVPQRSAGRRARVQREDRQDGVELPHHPPEGRVRQRDVGRASRGRTPATPTSGRR